MDDSRWQPKMAVPPSPTQNLDLVLGEVGALTVELLELRHT
jgi:hypothetical protein